MQKRHFDINLYYIWKLMCVFSEIFTSSYATSRENYCAFHFSHGFFKEKTADDEDTTMISIQEKILKILQAKVNQRIYFLSILSRLLTGCQFCFFMRIVAWWNVVVVFNKIKLMISESCRGEIHMIIFFLLLLLNYLSTVLQLVRVKIKKKCLSCSRKFL